VAIETPETQMYDANGSQVFHESQMVGRPTKFKLTKPENVMFADETGCNNNQKSYGNIGGECLFYQMKLLSVV
jgi:hypothetical protein